MDDKEKTNIADVAEALPSPSADSSSPAGDGQVTDSSGQVVTLNED